MNKGKQWKEGTGKISLFEFLDIAACHYTSPTISTARRFSKGNVCSREGTDRRSARSHDGLWRVARVKAQELNPSDKSADVIGQRKVTGR
jgi:hypothetical protein